MVCVNQKSCLKSFVIARNKTFDFFEIEPTEVLFLKFCLSNVVELVLLLMGFFQKKVFIKKGKKDVAF